MELQQFVMRSPERVAGPLPRTHPFQSAKSCFRECSRQSANPRQSLARRIFLDFTVCSAMNAARSEWIARVEAVPTGGRYMQAWKHSAGVRLVSSRP